MANEQKDQGLTLSGVVGEFKPFLGSKLVVLMGIRQNLFRKSGRARKGPCWYSFMFILVLTRADETKI